MGVFANQQIDFAAIAEEMRETIALFQKGYVRVVEPAIGEAVYDVASGVLTTPPREIVWQGPARIQTVRSGLNADQGYQYAKVTGVRFQVPLSATGVGLIRSGLEVYVLDGGNDPVLERMQFTVSTALNSTVAFLRTIECETNLKADHGESVGEFGGFPDQALYPEG